MYKFSTRLTIIQHGASRNWEEVSGLYKEEKTVYKGHAC